MKSRRQYEHEWIKSSPRTSSCWTAPDQELHNVDEGVEEEAVEATTWGEGPWEEVGEDFTDEKIAELTSLNWHGTFVAMPRV